MPRASAAQRGRWNRRLRSVSNRAEAATRAAMMRELNRAGERWDAGRHERAVKDILASAYRACAEASYPTARAMLGRAGREQVRSDADPARVAWLSRVGGWVETMSARRARQIARESQRQVTAALREAAEAGDSEAAAAQRVRDRLGGAFARSRARTIARTEIGAAQNMAVMEAGNASGVEFRKVWCAAADERTRPSHAAADGQEVAPDEAFEVGDATLDRPGDPAGDPAEVISCRCTILLEPVIDDGAATSGAGDATVPDPADAVAPVQLPPPPPPPVTVPVARPIRPAAGDERPPPPPIKAALVATPRNSVRYALSSAELPARIAQPSEARLDLMTTRVMLEWRALPDDAPPRQFILALNAEVARLGPMSDRELHTATFRTWATLTRDYQRERGQQLVDEGARIEVPARAPTSGWIEDDGAAIHYGPPRTSPTGEGAPFDPAERDSWYDNNDAVGVPKGQGRSWRGYIQDDYAEVNGTLRQGETPVPRIRTIIADLDRMIDESPGLTEDLVVYRGVKERDRGFTDAIVGRELDDDGFQSWSVNPISAQRFSGWDTDGQATVFRIRLPSGTKAIAGTDYESEVVLGRGRRVRVVGVSLRWVYPPGESRGSLLQIIDVEFVT